MQQNEQNPTSQNLRCKNDELQQTTRQSDKMKTQDEKKDDLCRKTTCNNTH